MTRTWRTSLTMWLALIAAPGLAADLQQRDSALDPALMRIDEPKYLGTPLARETPFVDADGTAFAMQDVLGKPVILLLSYYGCDGSCPTMNANLERVLADVKRFRMGEDYRVLTVSFDAADTPQTATAFLDRTKALGGGKSQPWRHATLRGSAEAVRAFAAGVGFRFFWSQEEKVFLHPNVLVFLTPEGRVARYLYGTRLDAQAVELALIDADWGRIAESTAIFDILTGACYSYNYAEGRYQPNYSLLAGIGSLLSGIALTVTGFWWYRRKHGGDEACLEE
ncbi:MAG: SCO family protein [Gammaproteobacteria bacterium]|nr:SCO family protein [Gammaproteobacteria bacterium]MBU1416629.1 SCO family protein [Gammaproteobacteria bacterium]